MCYDVAAMLFRGTLIIFCVLLLSAEARTAFGTDRQLPKSTIIPGFPITVKTDDPGVQQAARFGVYRYNNRSNDIFLFRESCISKATLQVVRGLKYTVNVDIGRTVCTKRTHPDLDRCAFQRNKTLRQTFSCYFEVWITPWLHRVQILASSCQ